MKAFEAYVGISRESLKPGDWVANSRLSLDAGDILRQSNNRIVDMSMRWLPGCARRLDRGG
jgi:hypothetical protein